MNVITTNARQAVIFGWLWNPEGVLHRYRVPDHLGDDAIRAEVGDLVRDLDDTLPGGLDADALDVYLEGTWRALRRSWAGLWWPPAKVLIEAAHDAAQAARTAHGAGFREEVALRGLTEFYAAHGRPLAGVATPARTAELIRRGILSAREARHAGFPLTPQDDAEARRQPPCQSEIETAIRCRARLRGLGAS